MDCTALECILKVHETRIASETKDTGSRPYSPKRDAPHGRKVPHTPKGLWAVKGCLGRGVIHFSDLTTAELLTFQ